MTPLAQNPDGTALLDFRPGVEPPAPADLDAPLPLALVAATHAGRVVLVRNAYRDVWELPGGMIDPGETSRQAALRELAEETAIRVAAVDHCGTATFTIAPDGRREHGALYRVELDSAELPARTPDDEIREVRWWTPGERLAGLDPIDAWLARAALAACP